MEYVYIVNKYRGGKPERKLKKTFEAEQMYLHREGYILATPEQIAAHFPMEEKPKTKRKKKEEKAEPPEE